MHREIAVLPLAPQLSAVPLSSPLPRFTASTYYADRYSAHVQPMAPKTYAPGIYRTKSSSSKHNMPNRASSVPNLKGLNYPKIPPSKREEPEELARLFRSSPRDDRYNVDNWISQAPLHVKPDPSALRLYCVNEVDATIPAPLRTKTSKRHLSSSEKSRRPSLSVISEQSISGPPATTTRLQNAATKSFFDNEQLINTLEHFSAFSILDTLSEGEPLVFASDDLWNPQFYEAGHQYFLDLQRNTDKLCEIITDTDDDGNELTYLVLFGGFPSPTTGQNRFLLASFIDITKFLDTVTIDDMNIEKFIRQSYTAEKGKPPTAAAERRSPSVLKNRRRDTMSNGSSPPNSPASGGDIWIKLAVDTHHESPINNIVLTPSDDGDEDDWSSDITIINDDSDNDNEENSKTREIQYTSSAMLQSILDEFTNKLLNLYKNYFILARSPHDSRFYEISHVSPSLYVQRDYVAGHLSHTPPAIVAQLSRDLGRRSPCRQRFSLEVKWGDDGIDKRLYCVPLFGEEGSESWICMLIDSELPLLWS